MWLRVRADYKTWRVLCNCKLIYYVSLSSCAWTYCGGLWKLLCCRTLSFTVMRLQFSHCMNDLLKFVLILWTHLCSLSNFFWCCFKNLWSGVRRKWLFGKHITVFIQRNANQTIRSVKHNLLIILVIFWRLKALSWENFEICLFVLLILINRCDELLFFQCSLHYFVIREMCKIF